MTQEMTRSVPHGFVMLPALLLGMLAGLGGIVLGAQFHAVPVILGAAVVGVASFIGCFGFFMVEPNEAKVLTLFGSYAGTAKEPGLRWANPFYTKRTVSMRVRNFQSETLKVNDHSGNPIEIGAVVVWNVVDTAQASFDVQDAENFVSVQTEAAVRNLATRYAYDAHGEGEMSLRSHTEEIAEKLKVEVQNRLSQAGVKVLEARISHLAYAPEIANAMLRRQQAQAVVAARQKIVEGAVGMVEMALDMLSKRNVVELDQEKKATMVSNLLVVLCGERETQPVVNAGTLYH
jgi:regulator of protease activity HflC (stomatin/prohibitin superfamily)